MENTTRKDKRNLRQLLMAVLIVGAVIASAVAIVPQIAQAQDVTPQPPNSGVVPENPYSQPNNSGFLPPFDRNQLPRGNPGFEWMRKPGFGGSTEYDTYLAEALGITVEELQAAHRKADLAMLEQSIADGKITEEQAEMIKANQALRSYLERDVLISQALGITTDELRSSFEAGKSLETLVAEQGMDAEGFQQAVQKAYQTAVQNAVEDGVITQEIADQILSEEAGRGAFGGIFHGPGRHGGPANGMGMTNPNSLPTEEAGQ